MGISRGNITTNIIRSGLVFNMDAANRASYVNGNTKAFNTTNLSQSGSFINGVSFNNANKGSWNFDGSDDYIDCNQISSLAGASSFTVLGWFNQTTLDQQRFMFGTYISTSNLIGCYTWSDGNMYVDIRNGSITYGMFDYSTAVSAETWFHCACVFNGSGATDADKIKIYINGVNQTLSYNGTLPTSTNATQGDFRIGGLENYTQEWLGKIANTHIYNRALSSTEVLHNYNALKSRFE